MGYFYSINSEYIFPIMARRYWWMTTYFILYFFTPFINKLIGVLSRKQMMIFLGFSMLFFSFMPTFTRWNWLVEPGNLPLFLTLYVFGAYVKKYDIKFFEKNTTKLAVLILSVLFVWGSTIICKAVGAEDPFYFVWPMYKTPIVVLAIFLFDFILRFKNIKLKSVASEVITYIGGSVFGVYLIHMSAICSLFYKEWFKNGSVYRTNHLIIHLLVTVLIIFMSCAFVDFIRIKLLEKPLLKRLKKYLDKVDNLELE